MLDTIDSVVALLRDRGSVQYGGEPVTQLEHALQCAVLAQAAAAAPALIAAALLHDLGHLLDDLGERGSAPEVDDRHEYRALRPLRTLFPAGVLVPIRLHVQAKRYLCAVSPRYLDRLSPESRRSLARQGGVLGPGEARDFAAQPFAGDAVRLRGWDDAAKVPGLATPPLAHFLPILERCRRRDRT